MQDYNYGDKVNPSYMWKRNGWDYRYRNRKYNKIYSQYSNKYFRNKKYNRNTGWGFKDTGKIGPEYDPNAHFVNPYYDYDIKGGNGAYWRRM